MPEALVPPSAIIVPPVMTIKLGKGENKILNKWLVRFGVFHPQQSKGYEPESHTYV
jgi:hypothetical protein